MAELVDLALVTATDAENLVLGDLRVDGIELGVVRGSDAVAQAAAVELRWWLGEWFLDRRRGVPYVQRLFRKGVGLATVRAVLRRQLGRAPGVDRVMSIRVEADRASRELSINFELRTVDGETVTGSSSGLGG